MKKILFLLCALAVTNVTFAQERANKSNEQVTKEEAIYAKASSFKFDSKTNTITEVVMPKFLCLKVLGCEELIKTSRRQPIIFTTKNIAIDFKAKDARDNINRKVSGIIVVGENKYKADLFFHTSTDKDKKVSFIGNIVLEGSSLESTEGKAVTITIKGIS
jgi:hypothetical protein